MEDERGSQIRRSDSGGIVTVTFTRDKKLNAVSEHMLAVLREAVRDFDDDPGVRALLITAEGRYFTAGADISAMGPQSDSGVAMRHDYRRYHEVFDQMETIEKPVILAAQGPCLGVGVEMASSCDFRLASTTAYFGLPEIRNLGVLPGSGGISRLTRLVGPHWARWLAMAGEQVTAEEAVTMGFVHKVFAAEGFGAAARAWTEHLIENSGEALGLAKVAIDAAAGADGRTARRVDRIANSQLVKSREHLDMVESFRSKPKS